MTYCQNQESPQYNFLKGLEQFGDKGYMAALKELKDNLVGQDCIKMLTPKQVKWDIKKLHLDT